MGGEFLRLFGFIKDEKSRLLDYYIRHNESANQLIHSSLIRNDNSRRKDSQNFELRHQFLIGFHPRPKGALHFFEPLIADGFRVSFLPWVARSKVLFRNDRAFVRDYLPKVGFWNYSKSLKRKYSYLFISCFNLFRILSSVKNIRNIDFTTLNFINDFVLAS
jgi:hypothetical protein